MKNSNSNSDVATLRQRTKELLNKKYLKTASQLSRFEALKLVHEHEVHQIELELRNDELLLAKVKVAERAAEKYAELYDNAPLGYFTLSKAGKIVDLNQCGLEMLGIERSRLNKSNFDFFVSDDTKPIFNHFLITAFGSKEKNTCEVILSIEGNVPMYVQLNGVADKNGEQCFVTAVDITESKHAEETLRESETRLDEALKIARLGTWEYDVDRNQFKFNDKFYRLLHTTVEREGGYLMSPMQYAQKFVHPDDMALVGLETQKALETSDPNYYSRLDHRIICADGEIDHIAVNIRILKDSHGRTVKTYGVNQIITERKQAENVLKNLIEMNPISIQLMDKDGFTLKVNPAHTLLFDADPPPGFSIFDDLQNKGFGEYILAAKKGEVVHFPDIYYNVHDAFPGLPVKSLWIHAMLFPLINSNGIFDRFVFMHEDITERKMAEVELRKAKEHAEESDRLKTSFLNNISHEIRTPFNGILGFLAILEDNDLTPGERAEYTGVVNKSAYRLMDTINDIVEISQIQAGQIKLIVSEANLTNLITGVYDHFKTEANSKGLKLLINNGLPNNIESIYTDSSKLNSTLTILIGNAIKFTPTGSVEIGVHSAGDYLEFSVKDTGVGIPENKQQAIFERFMQGDGSNTRHFEGSGLGLSIAKAYVQMLGGEIWVESTEGKGAEFYFSIPFKYNQKEKNKIDMAAAKKEENQINPGFPRLKILIADDDESSGTLMKITLRKYGKEIIVVKNGLEVVEACRKNPDIDLVLMDIKMPGMDGYEATEQIRLFNKDVIIIAQTAYALNGDSEKTIAAGCNDYIAKPIRKDKLSGLMEKYFKIAK